jgi:hypothetical protein
MKTRRGAPHGDCWNELHHSAKDALICDANAACLMPTDVARKSRQQAILELTATGTSCTKGAKGRLDFVT